MSRYINKIILYFTEPNIIAFEYDDHIETQSGQKLDNVKELIKIHTKKIKDHDGFIKFVLKEINNVTRKDILKSLEKNNNNYEYTLYDLM